MPLTRLIGTQFLHRLETLGLYSRSAFAGHLAGDRKSKRKGASIEFLDFREYTPGDDLRYVDWKAYGRLSKMYLKQYLNEEDLSLHLLIDRSSSMGFGSGQSKFDYSVRLAAMLGFIALSESDRVDAFAFSTKLDSRLGPIRGKHGLPEFFRFLERLPDPEGETMLSQSLVRYASIQNSPGMLILFSDFLDENIAVGLRSLLARRHQVTLVHVVDPQEAAPSIAGDYRFVDSETGASHEITVTPHLLQEYRNRYEEFCTDLKTLARRHNCDYIRLVTETPVESAIFNQLRELRILR